MLENTKPTMAELNPQYYSAALQAELLYQKIYQSVAEILNSHGLTNEELQNIFADISVFLDTSKIEPTEKPIIENEQDYFDVLYNNCVVLYNKLVNYITYYMGYDSSQIKNLIEQKRKILQDNIINIISSNQILSKATITTETFTIPIKTQLNKGVKIAQDFDNEQVLRGAYTQLCSRNIFPSSYKVKGYTLKKGMRPIQYGGFQYSVNEFGGLVVELIADAVSDEAGNNTVTYVNVGADFSNYLAPTEWKLGNWNEDDNNTMLPYKRRYRHTYAFPLYNNKKYYFHCATNYEDLALSQPVSNSIIYETYEDERGNQKSIYFQTPDRNGIMVPPIKFQINYAIHEEKDPITGDIIANYNYTPDGIINIGYGCSSLTVLHSRCFQQVYNNRVLHMSNIELGAAASISSNISDTKKQVPYMRPFWEQMIRQKEKGERKLVIYPILIEVEPDFQDAQLSYATYSFLIPYKSGTADGKVCPVYKVPEQTNPYPQNRYPIYLPKREIPYVSQPYFIMNNTDNLTYEKILLSQEDNNANYNYYLGRNWS